MEDHADQVNSPEQAINAAGTALVCWLKWAEQVDLINRPEYTSITAVYSDGHETQIELITATRRAIDGFKRFMVNQPSGPEGLQN
jgi:hypothetical protein